jgi:hypothetical protein
VGVGQRRTNTFLRKEAGGRSSAAEEDWVRGTDPLDIVRRRDGEGKKT